MLSMTRMNQVQTGSSSLSSCCCKLLYISTFYISSEHIRIFLNFKWAYKLNCTSKENFHMNIIKRWYQRSQGSHFEREREFQFVGQSSENIERGAQLTNRAVVGLLKTLTMLKILCLKRARLVNEINQPPSFTNSTINLYCSFCSFHE